MYYRWGSFIPLCTYISRLDGEEARQVEPMLFAAMSWAQQQWWTRALGIEEERPPAVPQAVDRQPPSQPAGQPANQPASQPASHI